MLLKKKIKKVIDSVVLGRPVYVCTFPEQLGLAYYEITINMASKTSNGPLKTIPLSSGELAEAQDLIQQAKDVYQQRVILQEKQNILYNTLTPINFIANVSVKDTTDTVELTINVTGNTPKLESLEDMYLTFTSELNVNYQTGLVSLVRHSQRTYTLTLPQGALTEHNLWMKNANGKYVISRDGYGKEAQLLGPSTLLM